jgi:hypothetical protein
MDACQLRTKAFIVVALTGGCQRLWREAFGAMSRQEDLDRAASERVWARRVLNQPSQPPWDDGSLPVSRRARRPRWLDWRQVAVVLPLTRTALRFRMTEILLPLTRVGKNRNEGSPRQ